MWLHKVHFSAQLGTARKTATEKGRRFCFTFVSFSGSRSGACDGNGLKRFGGGSDGGTGCWQRRTGTDALSRLCGSGGIGFTAGGAGPVTSRCCLPGKQNLDSHSRGRGRGNRRPASASGVCREFVSNYQLEAPCAARHAAARPSAASLIPCTPEMAPLHLRIPEMRAGWLGS